ncbi:MAG: transketolase [Alphaproteobacteria bacterium]|nr:transketolase [Alphaproteobacteria bacterium]
MISPDGDTTVLARAIRSDVLRMVHHAHASHVGSCLSVADILAVLYGGVLRVRPDEPNWPDRDRLILSKGHAAAALYAVLAHRGFFPRELLARFCDNGSPLTGHVSHAVAGVEVSTGSLGHGLSMGLGMALAARMDGTQARVFVVMSDGECDEGSTWEAALYAGHAGLHNLVALVDYNKIQSFGRVRDVLDLEPLLDKWRAFNWTAEELDGHDHRGLAAALTPIPATGGRPTILMCHTVKGKGVSFMEDRLEWHYRSPTAEQLEQALAEVNSP